MLTEKSLKDLEVVFKGLANKRRLKILKFLKENGEQDAGSIADYFDIDYKLTFPHLERLLRAKLIKKRREGKFAYFSITKRGESVLDILTKFNKEFLILDE